MPITKEVQSAIDGLAPNLQPDVSEYDAAVAAEAPVVSEYDAAVAAAAQAFRDAKRAGFDKVSRKVVVDAMDACAKIKAARYLD